MPKTAFAGEHRGRRDEQSDAAKENVYDENRIEGAFHLHRSFLEKLGRMIYDHGPYQRGIYQTDI